MHGCLLLWADSSFEFRFKASWWAFNLTVLENVAKIFFASFAQNVLHQSSNIDNVANLFSSIMMSKHVGHHYKVEASSNQQIIIVLVFQCIKKSILRLNIKINI